MISFANSIFALFFNSLSAFQQTAEYHPVYPRKKSNFGKEAGNHLISRGKTAGQTVAFILPRAKSITALHSRFLLTDSGEVRNPTLSLFPFMYKKKDTDDVHKNLTVAGRNLPIKISQL